MFLISDAMAQGAPAGGEQSPTSFFVMMAIMMVVFYFLILRPQSKKQKELKAMLGALSKGDEIVTSGGMVGRITEMGEQYITLQVATAGDKAVSIVVQRGAIQTLLPKGTMKSVG
jgi:preprotein translocase subunit YajC